jgi:hypothetical protein
LKIKVEQVEREASTPQVVLQKSNLKIKVEHVEGASRSTKTKFENQNRACRKANRSTKIKSKYQSKRIYIIY